MTDPRTAARRRRWRWADDRGMAAIGATVMILVVLAGAALIYDGGRALAARRQIVNVAEAAARAGAATVTVHGLPADQARQATLDFLAASGVAASDIVAVEVTQTTVTVTLRASRDAVFTALLGNERIVVVGTGKATATFGGGP